MPFTLRRQWCPPFTGSRPETFRPWAQATLNVGTIHGGSAPNIIADQAVLGVMMRNVSRESRDVMRHQIETLAKGITESMGGTCDIAFRGRIPAVYNDVEFTKTVEQAFRSNADRLYENMGDGRPEGWLITDLDPMLGAEDFGFFCPGGTVLYDLCGNGRGCAHAQSRFPGGRALHQALHQSHGFCGGRISEIKKGPAGLFFS